MKAKPYDYVLIYGAHFKSFHEAIERACKEKNLSYCLINCSNDFSPESIEALKGRIGSKTRVDISGHGGLIDGNHMIDLYGGNQLLPTRTVLEKLSTFYAPDTSGMQIHLWSCYAGAALKDKDVIPNHVGFYCHASAEHVSQVGMNMDNIMKGIMRHPQPALVEMAHAFTESPETVSMVIRRGESYFTHQVSPVDCNITSQAHRVELQAKLDTYIHKVDIHSQSINPVFCRRVAFEIIPQLYSVEEQLGLVPLRQFREDSLSILEMRGNTLSPDPLSALDYAVKLGHGKMVSKILMESSHNNIPRAVSFASKGKSPADAHRMLSRLLAQPKRKPPKVVKTPPAKRRKITIKGQLRLTFDGGLSYSR